VEDEAHRNVDRAVPEVNSAAGSDHRHGTLVHCRGRQTEVRRVICVRAISRETASAEDALSTRQIVTDTCHGLLQVDVGNYAACEDLQSAASLYQMMHADGGNQWKAGSSAGQVSSTNFAEIVYGPHSGRLEVQQ